MGSGEEEVEEERSLEGRKKQSGPYKTRHRSAGTMGSGKEEEEEEEEGKQVRKEDR